MTRSRSIGSLPRVPNVLLLSTGTNASPIADQIAAIAKRYAGTADILSLHEHPFAAGLRDLPRVRSAVAKSDIIHAFGSAALAMAVVAASRSIVYTPTRWPNAAAIAWLRAAMAYRRIHVICESDTLRRAYVTRGIPADRCTIIRPGVSMGGASSARDESLRSALGFTAENRVILAPLPVGMGGDHGLAIWAVSVLNVVDARYRVLVINFEDGARAARLLSRLMDARVLVIANRHLPDVKLADLYAAADAVLLTPSQRGRSIDVVSAMARMRPIFSTVTPVVCEFLEDRHTALLARNATPRMVARRIMDGFEDPALLHSISDRARAEVYEHFTISKMLDAIDAIYAKSYSIIVAAGSNPTPV